MITNFKWPQSTHSFLTHSKKKCLNLVTRYSPHIPVPDPSEALMFPTPFRFWLSCLYQVTWKSAYATCITFTGTPQCPFLSSLPSEISSNDFHHGYADDTQLIRYRPRSDTQGVTCTSACLEDILSPPPHHLVTHRRVSAGQSCILLLGMDAFGQHLTSNS